MNVTMRWLKRLRRRERTLPLRLWLILAVAAITGGGFLAQMGMTVVVAVWDQQAADAQLASVRQIIGTDAARWRDATWQRHAQTSLGALGVDVAVFSGQPGESGQLAYATVGARRLLPLDTGNVSGNTRAPGSPERLVFQRIVIADSPNLARPAAGRPPAGVAFLWYTQPLSRGPSGTLWPAVELGTFALTLAIVVWLVGQPVLRPLAEMSQTAEGIAGGDLDVHLPPSPVREIAAVSAALEGMSGVLREALASQTALAEERRLFVSAIAHDLRTPLFMLRGYLKGLERGVAATPEKMAHYVDACRVQADALERLIADLFAYARLEYLELEPERTPFELDALLRETVAGAQPLAAAKGITLALDAPAEPCLVLGDSRLLARAIGNLLDNALRHTPEGGQIRVCWRREEAALVFAVEDSGPGIAAHDLPHLFTPLYRGEASRNRGTGGAGLGLTIAQRILRAHGGDLTAANGPSGGAVFTGTLPAARRPAHPSPTMPEQPISDHPVLLSS
jgi:signal transduction histidine kinase